MRYGGGKKACFKKRKATCGLKYFVAASSCQHFYFIFMTIITCARSGEIQLTSACHLHHPPHQTQVQIPHFRRFSIECTTGGGGNKSPGAIRPPPF